jgi:NAD(P)H-hydrate epimerase
LAEGLQQAEVAMIESGCWPLVGADRMRALDLHSIEKLGVPGEVLMESAGRAVVDALLARFSALLHGAPGAEVLVVCGAGNNGGDGFVIARHLHGLGIPVRVALLADLGRLRGDAAANLERLRSVGVSIEGADWAAPARGVVVDALFGTGLARNVEGALADSIARINASASEAVRIVAVDLPSGLASETGQILGAAVQADVTVTISLPKLGLVLEPGRSHAGEILVARIGIVDALPSDHGVEGTQGARLWSAEGAARWLPTRPRDGHKGRFGHVLVVAGSEGKTGAAALTALGAGRGGAGLITLACPRSLNDILEVKCTEAMTVALPETEGRAHTLAGLEEILALAAERDVAVIGPGLGQAPETVALVREVVGRIDRPLVLDADALNALANDVSPLRTRRSATILTPHPGEAARLLGRSAAEINRDRVAAARELAERAGAVVLLKGAATVVSDAEGRVYVNPTGGPVLAAGGSGDVLAGLVAALLGQGVAALEAAALSAWLHGAAADRLAARSGPAGMLATELANELPAAADALRHVRDEGSGRGRNDQRDVGPALLSFP